MRISLASLDPGSYGNFVDGVSVNGSLLAVAPEPGFARRRNAVLEHLGKNFRIPNHRCVADRLGDFPKHIERSELILLATAHPRNRARSARSTFCVSEILFGKGYNPGR